MHFYQFRVQVIWAVYPGAPRVKSYVLKSSFVLYIFYIFLNLSRPICSKSFQLELGEVIIGHDLSRGSINKAFSDKALIQKYVNTKFERPNQILFSAFVRFYRVACFIVSLKLNTRPNNCKRGLWFVRFYKTCGTQYLHFFRSRRPSAVWKIIKILPSLYPAQYEYSEVNLTKNSL